MFCSIDEERSVKRFPTDFWGKLERNDNGGISSWHPLEDHCADVAACCEVLLGSAVISKRLARTGEYNGFDDQQKARLCALAALHDIGKFNHGFQNKARLNPSWTAGHVKEVLALFDRDCDESTMLAEALEIDFLSAWAGGPEATCFLLAAALCHHGRPVPLGEGFQRSHWHNSYELTPFEGIARLVNRIKKWFPQAWEGGSVPLPSCPAFQHAFSGLVMLADWLGSDTRFFPFTTDEDAEAGSDHGGRMTMARRTARLAAIEIGLDVSRALAELGSSTVGFDRISLFKPRDAQRRLLDLPVEQRGGITILEAETGAGKTEAALARFLLLFQAGEVEGLYFALPTRTAATQIFRRVYEAMKRAFPDGDKQPPVVLAVPGYIAVDDRIGRRLPGFEVLWADDEAERWRFRGWAAEHPKRYLAGAVVVGTVDQVLLSALAVSHSALRATALLRHLLVIDEVHASDAYMNHIIEEVLRRHVGAGGHAVLMSATLGSWARERLLSLEVGVAAPPLAEAIDKDYPLISHHTTGIEGKSLSIAPTRGSSKAVSLQISGIMEEPERIAELALASAREGARTLVVRNTVGGCLETQAVLERLAGEGEETRLLFNCRGRFVPHHSRFAREDRGLLDDAIEAAFGKQRPAGGCVAVATQTVQQSLDLDADLLVTDLCPADVLLQRIGRLHRHDCSIRPVGYDQARAIVLVPARRDLTSLIRPSGAAPGPHGVGTVYEDLRVLEATWRVLEAHEMIHVPEDCRELVERSLHPEALEEICSASEVDWRKHHQKVWGGLSARRRQAHLNLADRSVDIGSPESLFVSTESGRRIMTRLGAEDRQALFDEPLPGPLGEKVKTINLPQRWVADTPTDAGPENITASGGIIMFSFGTQRFIYDRWGLRPCDDIQPADRIPS